MTVTTNDVQAIYPTNKDDLSGFLATAQVVVTNLLASLISDQNTLDQITIYLAAHFAEIGTQHGGLKTRKVGQSLETYRTADSPAFGFKSTSFGQTAMLLDSTGTLASASAKAGKLPALFSVLKPYQTYSPYFYGWDPDAEFPP